MYRRPSGTEQAKKVRVYTAVVEQPPDPFETAWRCLSTGQSGGKQATMARQQIAVFTENQRFLDAKRPDAVGQCADTGVARVERPIHLIILGRRLDFGDRQHRK
jgi:hypothetical protein